MTERRKAVAAESEQREQLAIEIQRRAAAETALREREERMRMAVDSADIGTWDFNPITGEAQLVRSRESHVRPGT